MGALVGLPDFGTAIACGPTVAYATFGGGAYLVMPEAGALTAFLLTMTRVAGAAIAAGGYAMLDLEVGCRYALDEALAAVRAKAPGATAAALRIDLGYARLVSAVSAVSLPEAATRPTMLGWSKNDGARWSQRLDLDAAELIKGAVQKGSLLFGVRIEFVVNGVAARAPASVSFVPAALMPQLLDAGQTSITREDLIVRLSDASRSAALQTAAARIDVAEAVADRVLAMFGQFGAAADPRDYPCFTVAGKLPAERLDWDLSQPAPGARGYALRLDTVSGLSGLDPNALVQETTIPPLDLGFRDVALAANLPAPRLGAPAIGVRLRAPPAPPNRPNGINHTVPLNPPGDTARVTLRFDPDEPLAYTAAPFALVAARGLTQEIDAPAIPSAASFVQLQARDFQLAFSHITASDRLIAAAVMDGTLTYAYGAKTATIPFKLAPGAADIALAMPIDATDASLSLCATTPDGTVLTLPAMAPGRVSLDFPAFAEYGPQTVAIHCAFQGDEPPLTLEFEPEDGAGAASVALAPSAPDNSWTYFASTPFKARYRFRPQGGAWSALLEPGAPLSVSAQGVVLESSFDPQPSPRSSAPAGQTAPASFS